MGSAADHPADHPAERSAAERSAAARQTPPRPARRPRPTSTYPWDPQADLPKTPDSWGLSLIRGRLLAVLASGLSLWGASGPAIQAARHMWAEGVTPEHIGAVMTQTTVVVDSATALLIAGGAIVAAAAAGASKLRSWWRHRV